MRSSRPPGNPFPSDAAAESPGRALLRLGLGLLALEAAFGALVLLLAHPPLPHRAVVRIALNKPAPLAPRLVELRPAPQRGPAQRPTAPRRLPPIILVALPPVSEPRVATPRPLLHDGRDMGLARLLAERLVLASHDRAPVGDALSRSDALLDEIAIPPLPMRDLLSMDATVVRDRRARPPVAGDALLAYVPPALLSELHLSEPDEDIELPPAPAAPSAADLDQLVTALDYDLDKPDLVPGIFLDRLPASLAEEPEARRRKALFLRTLLPLIVQANDRNLALRTEILALDRVVVDGAEPDEETRAAMARLLAEFRLERWDAPELLRRADIVPPSLALAQAATESGWGSSSYARDGNALFGQREFVSTADSAGRLVPRLRRFEDLGAAVAAYLRNLNTHRAYADFRRARAALRAGGSTPSGKHLVAYLTRYSEQGPVYIRYISGIMRTNDLGALDSSRLRQDAVEIATGTRRTSSLE